MISLFHIRNCSFPLLQLRFFLIQLVYVEMLLGDWPNSNPQGPFFSLATSHRGVGKTKYSFVQPSLQLSVLTWHSSDMFARHLIWSLCFLIKETGTREGFSTSASCFEHYRDAKRCFRCLAIRKWKAWGQKHTPEGKAQGRDTVELQHLTSMAHLQISYMREIKTIYCTRLC